MCSEIVWPCSVPIFLFSLKYIPLLLCELIIWCRTTTDDFLLIRIRISDACYDASELSLFSANRAHRMNSKMFFKSRRGKWSPDLNKMLLWGKAPNLLMANFHWNLSKLWHFSKLGAWASVILGSLIVKVTRSHWGQKTYWAYGLQLPKFIFINWLFNLTRPDLHVIKNTYSSTINGGAEDMLRKRCFYLVTISGSRNTLWTHLWLYDGSEEPHCSRSLTS